MLFMNIGSVLRFVRRNVYQHISFKGSYFVSVENIRKPIGFLILSGEHWGETSQSISAI